MKQHAAWRHPEVDMPGGIFRGGPRAPRCRPGQPWLFCGRRPRESGRTGSSSDPEPDYTREPGQLVLARILLARTGPGRRSPCSAGLSRASEPARRPRASRSATWPGSSVPPLPDRRRLIPAPPASLTADRPRAGGAADAGGGPVEPGHCPRIGGHPGHRQRHVGHVLGKLSAANRTESVARARELSLIP